jgi:hypothetical protein
LDSGEHAIYIYNCDNVSISDSVLGSAESILRVQISDHVKVSSLSLIGDGLSRSAVSVESSSYVWLDGLSITASSLSDVFNSTGSTNILVGSVLTDLVPSIPLTVGPGFSKTRNGLAATAADGDTSPDVSLVSVLAISHTSATTVVAFDGGVAGQEVSVYATNANTTLDHSASGGNLRLIPTSDRTLNAYTPTRFFFDGSVWREFA